MARKRRKVMKTSCICALLAALNCLVRAGDASPSFDTVPVVHSGGFRQEEASRQQQGSAARVYNDNQYNSTSSGRYGHSAVYLPRSKEILFIGGQLGTRGTFITNDVLSLDTTKPYETLANPRKRPDLSLDLPPNAWAASAIDGQERIWLIGGVTEECENDATAYLLDDAGSWNAMGAGGAGARTIPPRRRQAQAVTIDEGKGNSSIYVFAGIAEPYTCSLETVGYLAMDKWSTSSVDAGSQQAQTIPWLMPGEPDAKKLLPDGPPVSDYAAVRLQATDGIVYLGGQDATGRLLEMNKALLYNTTTRSWTTKPISGTAPAPQMGHTATALHDGRIVIYGGSSPMQNHNQTTLYVLDLTSSLNWTWHQPHLSKTSLEIPNRAWHTATLIDNGTIVYAYGLDTETSKTTDDIFFLSISKTLEEWTWSRENPFAKGSKSIVDSHVPIVAAVAGSVATPAAKALVQAVSGPFLENTSIMPHNSKADEVGALPGGNDPNGDDSSSTPARSVVVATAYTTRVPSTSETATFDTAPIVLDPTTTVVVSTPRRTSAATVSQSPATSDVGRGSAGSSSADESSEAPSGGGSSKVIAGSVTAAFVLALGAGVIALWMRKKAIAKTTGVTPMGEVDANDGTPPVSHLLYTRAAPRRMLSLGSSLHTTRTSKRNASGRSVSGRRRRNNRDSSSGEFNPLTEREAREAVDEFGRLPPLPECGQPSTPFGPEAVVPLSRPMAVHTTSSDSAISQESRASVASYPFLTSVPTFTSPLPELPVPAPASSTGKSRTLLRSHSMSTSSSTGSRTMDFVSPPKSSLKVFNVSATTPLPSREFEGSGDIADAGEDPFADFEEIRQNDEAITTKSGSATRTRNLDLLPAALRPHTPSRF